MVSRGHPSRDEWPRHSQGIFGNPRTENVDDNRQPLGQLQDVGGVLARVAESAAR